MSNAALLTAEEFMAMPSNGHAYELVKGELRETMPGGGFHGRIHLEIGGLLREHVRPRNLGVLMGAETGFRISRDPDTVRAPDLAFMTRERWEAQKNPDGFLEGAPDLAV